MQFIKLVVFVAVALEKVFAAPPGSGFALPPPGKVQPTMGAMVAKAAGGASTAAASGSKAPVVAVADLPDLSGPGLVGDAELGGHSALSILNSLGVDGGAAQGHPGRSASTSELNLLRRIVLQLEARIRVLEAIAFITIKMNPDHPAVVAALAAKEAYFAAAKIDPQNHGQGAPHGLTAAAFLRALATTPLPSGLDAATKGRFAAIFLMTAQLLRLPFENVFCYCDHFQVATVPIEGGRHMALVQFCFAGTLSLPDPAQLDAVIATIEQAYKAGEWGPVIASADLCFTYEDGIPYGSGARAHEINRVLTTVLCSAGGVKATKAPRGGAAKALANKGKGKGKGKDA